MLLWVRAAATPAASSTVAIVFETLTIQLQTSWIAAITRLWCFNRLLKTWFNLIIFFNFGQYLSCDFSFLNCWLMSLSLSLWIQIKFINSKLFFLLQFNISLFLVRASDVFRLACVRRVAWALAVVVSELWSLELSLGVHVQTIVLLQLVLFGLD